MGHVPNAGSSADGDPGACCVAKPWRWWRGSVDHIGWLSAGRWVRQGYLLTPVSYASAYSSVVQWPHSWMSGANKGR